MNFPYNSSTLNATDAYNFPLRQIIGLPMRVLFLLTLIFTVVACTNFPNSFVFNSNDQASIMTNGQYEGIPLERVLASPSLSGPTARLVKFSPDGKQVSFLKSRESDTSRYDLWAFDVNSGKLSMLVDSTILEPDEVELSEEEKALRERKRITGTKGIVAYDWGSANVILVPLGGDLYLVSLDGQSPNVQRLTETEEFEYDAKMSPSGNFVSFVRDGAVYAISLKSNRETQLTPSANPDKTISYGVAEFVAQEEMSRYTGYWWSGNDRYIAYTRVDESTVDLIPRNEIAADQTTVVHQRYPRAGRPNAIVDLFVRDLMTNRVARIDWRQDDWGPATDQYLNRVDWDGDYLIIQAMNRDQTILKHLVTSSSNNWETSDYISEIQENWINLNDRVWLEDNLESAITTKEDSGYRHIWSKYKGSEWKQITDGNWAIDKLLGHDFDKQVAYFMARADTPLEQHLYSVSLKTGEHNRITELGKYWSVKLSPDHKTFVGTSSNLNQPQQVGLYDMDGELIVWIEENALNEEHAYAPYLNQHMVPQIGSIEAEDGQEMYYSLLLPPNFDKSKKYPVILEVYGGPGVQLVTHSWKKPLDQYYVQNGYILFRLDNRGSGNRGKKFEDVVFRKLGQSEVEDQLRGVKFLKSLPYVDSKRIALQGWSYGGYMTLMTILQAPKNTFAAAVVGAPVADWSLYDTFYTERYMDTPQDNAEGYRLGSVFAWLDQFDTPMLLVHGMSDDNVLFDNTTQIMAKLQEAEHPFEVMVYPGQRHGIRGEELGTHLLKTRMNFLNRHLKSKE